MGAQSHRSGARWRLDRDGRCPDNACRSYEMHGLLLAFGPRMRVLVVLREPIATARLRERCGALVEAGHSVAVCYVPASALGLHATLDAQRKVTLALRQAIDDLAEKIPVFVATERDGDRIEDCARAWEATDVEG